MTREVFDSLSIRDQLDFVNSELSLGKTLTQIATYLTMSRSTLRRRFTKLDYVFDKDRNLYVECASGCTDARRYAARCTVSNVTGTQKYTEKCAKNHSPGTQEYATEYTSEKFMDLQKKVDEMYAAFLRHKEIDSSVEILTANYVRKTFRVEENILARFLELCDDSEYTQQEMISRALIDFINNY